MAAELDHVERPGRRAEIGTHQRCEVGHAKRPRVDDAAGGVAPLSGEHRQAVDRPQRHPGSERPLHADAVADRPGLRARVLPRELHDHLRPEAGDSACVLRRPRPDRRAEFVHAGRMAVEVVPIFQTVAEDHVRQAEGERTVGPGIRLDVEIGLHDGPAAVGIDDDEARPAAARTADQVPGVHGRADGVDAPRDDQVSVLEVLRLGAHRPAQAAQAVALSAADRPLQAARAERVEDGVHRAQRREQPHAAEVAVRQDRLAAALGDDGPPPPRDGVQRLVPRDPDELAAALLAVPPEGMEDAVRAVHPLEIAVHLHAQVPAGDRVGRVGRDLDGAAVTYRHEQRTGVGAIVGARGAHDLVHLDLLRVRADPASVAPRPALLKAFDPPAPESP